MGLMLDVASWQQLRDTDKLQATPCSPSQNWTGCGLQVLGACSPSRVVPKLGKSPDGISYVLGVELGNEHQALVH